MFQAERTVCRTKAGLCVLACSRRYKETQLPGLRVHEGQGWRGEGGREVMGARWYGTVRAAVCSLNTPVVLSTYSYPWHRVRWRQGRALS